MAQTRQHLRIALAGKDRADNPQAGRAGDVGDDVVSWRLISVNAFCICWMCQAAYSSRRLR